MNRVVLVGAGCGVGSLTLRGASLLAACDCVVYDSLLDEELLSMTRADCKKIFVGKRAGAHAAEQSDINSTLLDCGAKYPLTVRLKGGDPFVFGRGGEELAALCAAGIACGVVPGVSSAVAAAEYAGIPVTHRFVARGFRVYTAHTAAGDLRVPAPSADETLVFLMAKRNARDIRETLLAGGMSEDTPAAILSEAGMAGAKTARCTLKEIDRFAADLPAPMTIVVGNVCAEGLLGKEFARRFSAPRVAVTGTAEHIRRVSAALEARGFEAVPCAYASVSPLAFDDFFKTLTRWRWLVFTSANGADVFFARARACGVDFRAFGDKKFAAIGAQTARRLASYGFYADCVPKEYCAAALAEALATQGAVREETALLRAEEGSAVLLGAGVQVSLYRIRTDAEQIRRAAACLQHTKYVTFGSAGMARALLENTPLPDGVVPVCIGEETAKELYRRGYSPVVAAESTAEALADAVARMEES